MHCSYLSTSSGNTGSVLRFRLPSKPETSRPSKHKGLQWQKYLSTMVDLCMCVCVTNAYTFQSKCRESQISARCYSRKKGGVKKKRGLPAPSNGWCLNPKGLFSGTPYHPFGTPWRVQVSFNDFLDQPSPWFSCGVMKGKIYSMSTSTKLEVSRVREHVRSTRNTPWKIKGWNLQIIHLERNMIWTKPPWFMFQVNLQFQNMLLLSPFLSC